jgi:hypothetical protein
VFERDFDVQRLDTAGEQRERLGEDDLEGVPEVEVVELRKRQRIRVGRKGRELTHERDQRQIQRFGMRALTLEQVRQ